MRRYCPICGSKMVGYIEDDFGDRVYIRYRCPICRYQEHVVVPKRDLFRTEHHK